MTIGASIERAATVAAGCVWATCTSVPFAEPVAVATVGAIGFAAVLGEGLRKSGVESGAELARIRKATRGRLEARYGDLDALLDLREADAALAEDLRDCFLDRQALVTAALDPEGFPTKATEIVLSALAHRRPALFGPDAPQTSRDYAGEVVSAALWAAADNRAYFADIQARLTFEQMKALARLLETGAEIRRDIEDFRNETRSDLADLKAMVAQVVQSQAASDARDAGLSEDLIVALVRRFIEGGLSLEDAEAQLPKSAEHLRAIDERLSRLTNDEPEIAAKLAAARTAINHGDLDRADRLLAEAEAADLADIDRRRLRAAETIASRADLARSQARFLEAAAQFARSADLAEGLDKQRAWAWRFRQADALDDHASIFPGLDTIGQAIAILRKRCLPMADRQARPDDWAITQNSLGIALSTLGKRAGGETGLAALNGAVDAFRAALEIYTRNDVPADWAMAQNNLGSTLQMLGERAGGEAGLAALNEAVDAFRAALEVYTRQGMPSQWATIQNNLGNALQTLGGRAAGAAGLAALNDAVDAYSAGLEVYTRQDTPAQWATTQNNLGAALRKLGERAGGERGQVALTQAVDAYRAALQVHTRSDMPADWAMTQNNLGIALQTLGERAGGEAGLAALNDAIGAFRAALEIRTRKDMPAQWAMTQNNLGVVLQTFGEQARGEVGLAALNEAVDAHRAALEVRTRRDMPAQWAITQNNLGIALATLGRRVGGEAGLPALNEAVTAYRAALEIHTLKDMPAQWAATIANLGLLGLSMANGKALLREFEHAIATAAEAFADDGPSSFGGRMRALQDAVRAALSD